MQLKKIKRAEKKGTESVMDEKFSLLFQSQFSVGGGELMFQVWTLSLPVVVIVHGNQEPHAWATVTWDNAFSEPGRVPFNVPDKVPWSNVAETLSLKFRAATGRPLTEENIRFLAEKAFRGNFTEPNQMLSWAQFCKEPLSERNFTFWEWFYAVMKLTREHYADHGWMGNYFEFGTYSNTIYSCSTILGFIRKRQAEEMLQSRANGTFLLRFSDSELGGVTIAWVSENSEVFMLQPFTSKDFAIRSLADRISDLSHLINLYPEIPKDIVFNKYYTPLQDNQPTSINGYVKPLLVTHVPGWADPALEVIQIHRNIHSCNRPILPEIHLQLQAVCDVWLYLCSYAGSLATTMTSAGTGMEYLDQLDDCNIDLNGLVNLSELMQGYRQ
ncbi:hypothetical protein FQR65_LT18544 [Abscondita terminalis]|nr:hypothetical protein FQR65_LT18544 [Abscondita terminalis]